MELVSERDVGIGLALVVGAIALTGAIRNRGDIRIPTIDVTQEQSVEPATETSPEVQRQIESLVSQRGSLIEEFGKAQRTLTGITGIGRLERTTNLAVQGRIPLSSLNPFQRAQADAVLSNSANKDVKQQIREEFIPKIATQINLFTERINQLRMLNG